MPLSALALAILRAYAGSLWVPSPATCYQDSAGTTPGAQDQPVGLMLDGLGSVGADKVANGGFDSPSGWTMTAGCSVSGSALRMVSTGEFQSFYPTTNTALTIGRWYRATISATINAPYQVLSAGGTTTYATIANSGTVSLYFLAVDSGWSIKRTAACDNLFESISIVEVTGNHAYQATSGYRPILRRSAAGLWYLEFDGIDDRLQLNVPVLADDNAIVVAARPSIADANIRRLLSVNSAGSASIHPYLYSGALYGGWSNDAGQSVTLNVGGAAPANSALVATLRKVGTSGSLRKNGAVIASDSSAPVGAATFTSATIGNRFAGDRPFAGYQYGEATLLGSVPDAKLKIVERYLGQLAGVAL